MQTEAPAKKRHRCQGGQRLFALTAHRIHLTQHGRVVGYLALGSAVLAAIVGNHIEKCATRQWFFNEYFSLWLHQRRDFGRRILSHQALPNTKSTHAKPGATPSRSTWTIPTEPEWRRLCSCHERCSRMQIGINNLQGQLANPNNNVNNPPKIIFWKIISTHPNKDLPSIAPESSAGLVQRRWPQAQSSSHAKPRHRNREMHKIWVGNTWMLDGVGASFWLNRFTVCLYVFFL